MTDEETIKELKERIDGLEANVDELANICERLTDEFTRFTLKVEERFRSLRTYVDAEIRYQSHF